MTTKLDSNLRVAAERIAELTQAENLAGAWAVVEAMENALPKKEQGFHDQEAFKLYRNAVLGVVERGVAPSTPAAVVRIASAVRQCVALEAMLVAAVAPKPAWHMMLWTWLAVERPWVKGLTAIATLAILWGSAAALCWGAVKFGHKEQYPMVVFAMLGLAGLGATLAYEMTRPRDRWYEDTLVARLGGEPEVKGYANTIVDLYIRAGRLKRAASMSLGGTVVAIILFTMYVYREQGVGDNAPIVMATRIGGAVLLMFIVGTLMSSHAFTLRLAAHHEATADLLRIGGREHAHKLLLNPPEYALFKSIGEKLASTADDKSKAKTEEKGAQELVLNPLEAELLRTLGEKLLTLPQENKAATEK